jgi:hypothetical protein
VFISAGCGVRPQPLGGPSRAGAAAASGHARAGRLPGEVEGRAQRFGVID